MPVDAAEDWSLLDLSMGELVGEMADRTPSRAPMRDRDLAAFPGLIGLGPAQMQDDAPPSSLDIATVEPDQFGSTERLCEADQQQCLIAQVD
ncbi:hypothetical protein [Sphingobium chungbukense]|uniref:hypothetical protein n=1 Tax=Sphingobium chungbukense TaxID=56193 RepID=UPI0018DD98B6|nr:hypothetical protein [Sphingobium chungbukense]